MDFQRHWIKASGIGNLVAGKHIPDGCAVGSKPLRRRIVNRAFDDGASDRVGRKSAWVRGNGLTEISIAIGRSGNRKENVAGVLPLAILLPVEKEEGLVVTVIYLGDPHRAAESKAVIVPPLLKPDQVPGPVRIIRERLTRVQHFVQEIIVGASVELVAARFHGEIEQASAHLPVFGGEVAGLNGDFLDRVDTRLGQPPEAAPAQITVARVLAINPHSVRVALSSVDTEGARERGAWNQLRRNVWIPDTGADRQHGKLVQGLRRNVVAQLAAFGLQQGHGLGDGDRVRGRPHLKADVHTQHLRHAKPDVLPHVLLESLHADCELVSARGQLRHRVIASGRTRRLVNGPGLRVPHLNRRVGDYRARRVGNGARNRSTVALSKRG